MNDLLQELLGKVVEVRTRGGDRGYQDAGTLTAYDEHWIKLEKEGGEALYFPIANIRLVKPLG